MKLQRRTQDPRQVRGTPEPTHWALTPTLSLLPIGTKGQQDQNPGPQPYRPLYSKPSLGHMPEGSAGPSLACATISPQQGHSGVVPFCEQGAGQAANAHLSNKVELKRYSSGIFRSLREEEAKGLHCGWGPEKSIPQEMEYRFPLSTSVQPGML